MPAEKTRGAEEQKVQLFEVLPISRAVLTLAMPTVASSLVMVLYSLADTYFVSMLENPIQNSAVTLAAPVLLAFNAINNLFGVGASSMMSRALGRRDYETVRRSSAFGFWCALLSAVVFSLAVTVFQGPFLQILGADDSTREATAAYMMWTVSWGAVPSILNVVLAYLVRAEGSSLHASIGTMSGCLLNMILDPLFILPWGLNMGAAGAGLATFLSNTVACCYFAVLLFVRRGKTFVSVSPAYIRPKKEIVLGICGVGIPASIQNLLNVTGMTVLNNFTAGFGPDAVAAMGIAQKINMVPAQIALGFSQGIMPLVGYNYASGNVKRMKSAILFAGGAMLGFTSIMAVGYYVGAGGLSALFMKNEVVAGYCTSFLRGLCLAMPLLCVDFLGVGVFQSCGLGRNALLFAILRKIVLEIPALFLLNTLFPLYGLAYAQLTAEAVLAVAAVVVLTKLIRKLERTAVR